MSKSPANILRIAEQIAKCRKNNKAFLRTEMLSSADEEIFRKDGYIVTRKVEGKNRYCVISWPNEPKQEWQAT